MAGAEFGKAQRQVAVGLQALAVDLHVARAVHRLQRQDPVVVGIGREHVLTELLPVPRRLPQRQVDELRRLHPAVAAFVQQAADISLDHTAQRPALGVPDNRADRVLRAEDQRVGQESVSTGRYRWWQYNEKKKQKK